MPWTTSHRLSTEAAKVSLSLQVEACSTAFLSTKIEPAADLLDHWQRQSSSWSGCSLPDGELVELYLEDAVLTPELHDLRDHGLLAASEALRKSQRSSGVGLASREAPVEGEPGRGMQPVLEFHLPSRSEAGLEVEGDGLDDPVACGYLEADGLDPTLDGRKSNAHSRAARGRRRTR